MKILAVECSAAPASCAVVEDGRILALASTHNALTHSQTLLPMIADTLKTAALTMNDIDALAIANGPGSFTGVRIGVAAVKGLAFAENKPCYGVSTLAAIARRAEGMPLSGVICAAMDARCQQAYTACFRIADGVIERMTPDEALPLATLRERLAALDEPVLLMGDGAALAHRYMAENGIAARLAPPAWRYQRADGVAAEATRVTPVSPGELLPVYLRLPQAERELMKKQSQQQ
ncbi:MAG: tRNA (adenosine(37)-N6)-threonylcarbamoyltransferase complex dimerization subunit type 1 TsaB [Acutalibacteraceae bacterium]|jgi:tRNA threonylcarbamoyladenosine biosynthesis protein TsaB